MAVRRWQIHPDQLLALPNGAEIPVVSRDAFHAALTDVASIMDRAGGVVSIQSTRAETGFAGERVTTGLFFEWKDRTDARPQPEPSHPVEVVNAEPVPDFVPQEPQEPVVAHFGPESPDGLDVSGLPEEDVSSMPSSV